MGIEWLLILTTLLVSCVTTGSTSSNNKRYQMFAQLHSKFITSPNWPLQYPTDSDFFYTIEVKEWSNPKLYLELKWLEFDVKGSEDNCDDFVQVKYESRPNQTFVFCSTKKPHTIFSVGENLELHFHSDKSVVGYGFKIQFRLASFRKTIGQSKCRNEVILGRPLGVVSSPSWPISTNHLSCIYTINLQADEILQLNIMDFSMGSHTEKDCNRYNNFIEIRGTDSNNRTFSESCPIRFLSSCTVLNTWTILLKKRILFIHVNIMVKYKDQRGFLAGYTINAVNRKGTVNMTYQDDKNKTSWVSNAVVIGTITGVIVGLAIVAITIFGVSMCVKRRVI